MWYFAIIMTLMQAVTVGAVASTANESVPALLPADDRKPSYHLSLDAAYEAARQDECPVLMVFRAEWDVFSRAFSERTLDSAIFQSFGPCVHLAFLDVDRDSELTADYRVTFLPYLVLLSPDGKILAERKGILTPAELTQWVADGVERSNRGEWIGISASGELGKFLEKFRTGTDSAADRKDLIAFLGERHPGDRSLAADIIMANPRKFMDQLMTAVNDSHLGTRLSACELIGRLFSEAPLPDPWGSKTQRDEGAVRLQRWWDDRRRTPDLRQRETGLQSAGPAASAGKGPAPAAVRELIQEVQSADAVRRTRAMTELAGMGSEVVPALQHAINEAEALGKDDIVLLLEDTRWSIVVTAEVARALPQARRVLSRGTSKNRQELADALAKLGPPAVAVLAEMTREDDVLVQESAVRALAKINSSEATIAMADLLSSQNANLRMVTAQLLGKTGQPKAARYLKQLLQDPNDVVAATAISALEELKADSEATALIACLTDSRWRIRAAAAEVIGKLEIGSAGQDLLRLLDDPDPFVVRAALRALDNLKIRATPELIRKAAFKHPDLLRGIIVYILNSQSSELPQTIGELYEKADAAGKKQILTVLGQKEIEKKNLDIFWIGFFGGVMAVDDPQTRSLALLAMKSLWVELTQPYIENGLVDSDPQARLAAVKALLKLACYHYGASSSGKGPDYGILRYHQKTPQEIKAEFEKQHEEPPDNLEEKIKRAGQIAELHRTWHRLLEFRLGEPAQMREIMALGITGDAGQALAMLPAALTPEFIRGLKKRSDLNFALEQMLAKLKWPENRTLINELMQDPTTYMILLAHADKAGSELVSYMLRSPDLIRALSSGSKPLRKLIVKKLISNDSVISLMQPAKNIAETVEAFMAADDPLLKSMGIWAAGHFPATRPQRLTNFLRDPDPWVRRSAVVSVIRQTAKTADREMLLAPLLDDPSEEVLNCVLIGLLSSRLLRDDSIDEELSKFKYETYSAYVYEYRYGGEGESTRPFDFPNEQPEWLKHLRRRFDQRASFQNDRLADLMALVLAQYGDFSAFSSLVDQWVHRDPTQLNPIHFLTIEISRNTDYLPVVDRYVQNAREPSDLDKILQTVRHMKGQEVRQLRKRINRLLRTM